MRTFSPPWAGLIAVLALLAGAPALAQVPPAPETSDFVWDEAGLLSEADEAAIREIQARVARAHNVPLVVVTINRMSDHLEVSSIEDFTREWFDTWEIGSEGDNSGILLLVSKGDRKARIELGADWGRAWDPYCQRTMDGAIIPSFKAGDFSGGIRKGVQSLEVMAGIGTQGTPPSPGLMESIENSSFVMKFRATQPIPLWIATIFILVGVAMLVGAVYSPENRKLLVIAGALCIFAGISVYILVLIFGMFAKGGSEGGGYSGFGGGGFSGGGGASGSW